MDSQRLTLYRFLRDFFVLYMHVMMVVEDWQLTVYTVEFLIIRTP